MMEAIKFVHADTPQEFAATIRKALAEIAVDNGTGDTYGIHYQRANDSPRFTAIIHYRIAPKEESA